MSARIELFERARSEPGGIERLFSETSFPLVEGPRVTFAFHGRAEHVALRHWIFGLPSSTPFQRLGPDLWVLTIELPEGSRVEYKLELTLGGQTRLVRDPLNDRIAHDPFGANSVVAGEGYQEPGWAAVDPDARRGELTDLTITSAAFGEPRDVQVYLPARFRRTRRYPLLIVHDGADYLRFTALETVLDNLIHRLEIPPMVVALTSPSDRSREYADDERQARFLADELVPELEASYPLLGAPAGRGLVGASFGAVAALAAAWRKPGVFGRLLLESGSFAFTDIGDHERGPMFDPVVDFMRAFRADPGELPERIYLACGVYESLIVDNRSLLPVLQKASANVRFEESRDGHNWENWRDRLRAGLTWLFPGPLWMVYE